jgi:hypothetical protein
LPTTELKWARRVRQEDIRRLYHLDARGIIDQDLINDVGYGLHARCESIRIATEAHFGRVTCRSCGAVVERTEWNKAELLTCACGWRKTWGDYLASYQRKQLVGGAAYPAFIEYLERWPGARAPRDKLLEIDRLVHACHVATHRPWARPAAVNLIEGTASELARFLDELAYGPSSTPGLGETRDAWQRLRRERFFPRRSRG